MTKPAPCIVSPFGNTYQVDAALASYRVALVFDPVDLTRIKVRHPEQADRPGHATSRCARFPLASDYNGGSAPTPARSGTAIRHTGLAPNKQS